MNIETSLYGTLPAVTFLNTSHDPPTRGVIVFEDANDAWERIVELEKLPHITEIEAVDAKVTPR